MCRAIPCPHRLPAGVAEARRRERKRRDQHRRRTGRDEPVDVVDMTEREIAEVLGLSRACIHNTIHRALEKLRPVLEEYAR